MCLGKPEVSVDNNVEIVEGANDHSTGLILIFSLGSSLSFVGEVFHGSRGHTGGFIQVWPGQRSSCGEGLQETSLSFFKIFKHVPTNFIAPAVNSVGKRERFWSDFTARGPPTP